MKKYWYSDNWSGNIKYFCSLREAIKSARKEDGISISIFDKNGCIKTVDANGYVAA